MIKKLENNSNKEFIWSNGKIIKKTNNINTFNYSLNYSGNCVWEGIRSYKSYTKETVNIINLNDHIERLYNSAKVLGIIIHHKKDELIQGCKDIVKANGNKDLYLRPIVYTSEESSKIKSEEGKLSVSVDIHAVEMKPPPRDKGRRVGFSGIVRGYPQFQMQAKASMNYCHMFSANQEIRDRGLDDLLVQDNLGYITECLVSNIFIIKDGYLFTPPNNGSILPGITRKIVYHLVNDPEFKSNSIDFSMPGYLYIMEKQLTKADILTADEVFSCGTFSEVLPIVEVQGIPIGNGSIGKITKYIQQGYSDSIRGKRTIHGVFLDKV